MGLIALIILNFRFDGAVEFERLLLDFLYVKDERNDCEAGLSVEQKELRISLMHEHMLYLRQLAFHNYYRFSGPLMFFFAVHC